MDIKKLFKEYKSELRKIAADTYPILTADDLENAQGKTFEVLPGEIGKACGEVLFGLAEAELDMIAADLADRKLATEKARTEYVMDTYSVDIKYAKTVLTHAKNAHSRNRTNRK